MHQSYNYTMQATYTNVFIRNSRINLSYKILLKLVEKWIVKLNPIFFLYLSVTFVLPIRSKLILYIARNN